MSYVELQVTSNFSFLRGGAHGEELALTAAAQGHAAVGITDRNSLAGVVRLHLAAKAAGIKPLIGARLDLRAADPSVQPNPSFRPSVARAGISYRTHMPSMAGPFLPEIPDIADRDSGMTALDRESASAANSLSLLCYPMDRVAYGRLARLITLGRRRVEKGNCLLTLDDVLAHGEGQIFIVLAPAAKSELAADGAFAGLLAALARRWAGRCYLAASCRYQGDDRRRLALLAALARQTGAPLVASNDVHYHVPSRRPLQDVLTCIREHCTIREAGFRLAGNAERHLKSPEEMARLFKDHPDALARTLEIAGRINFSLDELRYEYPKDPVMGAGDPQTILARLTMAGARERYGEAVPEKVRRQLDHELALIGELNYAPYFLTVYDIVRFARSQEILCQGRGSAANSAVCYCLAITAVDPNRLDLLFERFISAERDEPPDIDVDFEHERREEVIQYIYEKYGRERAGIAATVISYRSKSAIREVGKALGLSLDMVGLLASNVWGWRSDDVGDGRLHEIGLDAGDETLALAIRLANELRGFPRHLSQHVGGFVITDGPLDELVPIENAAMEDRTFIEWDKDDLDALGILKIDVLGLGMLTCIRKCFELLRLHHRKGYELATVPAEDPAVYEMLCKGDSVGVFQVESRAQMTMLPRLKPRSFYDLVIEVAIVRPGPIQGDMVHPYLRRRDGLEPVVFPSKELEQVLGKTLGVPLFQEQAMRIAIVAAGFTPAEADKLRRAMATFRRTGTIHGFHEKMVEGMVARGYERDFADRCFRQIEGFGEYGFPESHAASFALLVYVSAWLKHYYPAAFACGLMNSQPMGFYAPAQIVRDARDHGVTVLPVDVNLSDWDNLLEPDGEGEGEGRVALRIGFRQIKGFKQEEAEKLMAARGAGYDSPEDLWRRAGLKAKSLERLANADAWRSVGLDRRRALWALKGLKEQPLPLFLAADRDQRPASPAAPVEPAAELPAMRLGEHVVEDFVSLRLSLKEHPVALLRRRLGRLGAVLNDELPEIANGARTTVAGLVITRQRPGTAKGVIFATLEDESGVANVVIWADVFETYRRAVVGARLLLVRGQVQREGLVIHVVAKELIDLSGELDQLIHYDSPADAPPLPTADAMAAPRLAAGRGAAGARHPRNVTLIGPRPGPAPGRIVPKSRDFH